MTTLTSGQSETIALAAQHTLTIVPAGTVSVSRLGDKAGEPGQGFSAVTTTTIIGPFAAPTSHRIVCSAGSLAYTVAPADFPTAAEALAAATSAAAVAAALVHLSVTDTAEAIGTLIEIIGEGVPDASAQAELDVNPAGDDNGLTFTAVAYGAGGNDISIAYIDPASNDGVLAVSVAGSAITVTLGTDSEGGIVSTAAEILAAIEADAEADALVTVAILTTDSGEGDDGSGIVTAMAADSLEGGAGVGVGAAGKGSRYTDVTNGKLYINGGTAAQPSWKIITSA